MRLIKAIVAIPWMLKTAAPAICDVAKILIRQIGVLPALCYRENEWPWQFVFDYEVHD